MDAITCQIISDSIRVRLVVSSTISYVPIRYRFPAVFHLTVLELQVPFQNLGFPNFDSFLAQVPNLGGLLKDRNSIQQTRTATPLGTSLVQLSTNTGTEAMSTGMTFP